MRGRVFRNVRHTSDVGDILAHASDVSRKRTVIV